MEVTMKKRLLTFTCCILAAGFLCLFPGPDARAAAVSAPAASSPSSAVPAGKISDLTGLVVSDAVYARRPLAVMYDNSAAAQPQSGLSCADIVYEAYAEGSVTRLMAVFEQYDSLTRIGPLRSCRDYFIHWACEYDPIFIHYGGPDLYVKTYYNLPQVNHLDGTRMEGTAFYRTGDRKAPHNAYTGASYLQKGILAAGYPSAHTLYYQGPHFLFSRGPALSPSAGIPANRVCPGFTTTAPEFVYNAADGKYYRSQYQKPHTDRETGAQLCFENLIIQYTDTLVRDKQGYLYLTTLDSGKPGWFIANGRAIPVTWIKDSLTGVTRYYDASGSQIKVNPGKTFISVLPSDQANLTRIL